MIRQQFENLLNRHGIEMKQFYGDRGFGYYKRAGGTGSWTYLGENILPILDHWYEHLGEYIDWDKVKILVENLAFIPSQCGYSKAIDKEGRLIIQSLSSEDFFNLKKLDKRYYKYNPSSFHPELTPEIIKPLELLYRFVIPKTFPEI